MQFTHGTAARAIDAILTSGDTDFERVQRIKALLERADDHQSTGRLIHVLALRLVAGADELRQASRDVVIRKPAHG
jgi:hypothetical protein